MKEYPNNPPLLQIGPELINAIKLDAWSATDESKRLFPKLIRKLLAATPGITNLKVRTNEGVSLPGWDGTLHSDGAVFLPSGKLFIEAGENNIEMGTNKEPSTKANEDLKKRTEETTAAFQKSTNYVFLTSRIFPGKDKWLKKQKKMEIGKV